MKKFLLTFTLLLAMMSLVACGSEDASKDTDEPDDTKEPVEPDDTEDPVVEMVDWETCAAQADNDEVCMVVWNETTGTQKILEPRPEGNLDLKNTPILCKKEIGLQYQRKIV